MTDNPEPRINGVDLRDYLEALAGAERRRIDQHFSHERELARLEFDKIEQATRLQAQEYERRLDLLNHAHEEARQVLNTYVPREAFEAYVKENQTNLERISDGIQHLREELVPTELYNQKHDALVDKVDSLEKWRNIREGAQDSLGGAGKFIVAAVATVGTILTIVVLLANHAI